MLVDLIRPPNPYSIDDLLDEPLGLLYLAASLREAGHEVRVTDMAGNANANIYEADVFGIQLWTPTAHLGVNIAKSISRMYPWALRVAGGPHVSACATGKGMNVFDAFVAGEGEHAFLRTVEQYGEHWNITKDRWAGRIPDLDRLPFPARDLVDMNKYHRKVDGHRSYGIIGSRGCSFSCRFCDRSLFGEKIRFRSIENIVKEIQGCDVKHFEFFDDMFPGNIKRAREFYEQTQGMGLNFRCNLRTDSPDYYKIMKDSGCSMVYFGIESGSQKILDLMNKGTTIEKNYKAIHRAHDAGLMVGGYFILGYPGETTETIDMSMEFIEKSGIDQAQFYMFVPLPGSEIYRDLDKYGGKLLTEDYSEYYHVAGEDGHGGRVIETEWLSADQMQSEMQRVRKFLRERGSKGGMQDYYKKKLNYEEK